MDWAVSATVDSLMCVKANHLHLYLLFQRTASLADEDVPDEPSGSLAEPLSSPAQAV
jgi:hypothetical protein